MEKKIQLLRTEKQAVASACGAVRADIEAFCDEKSFVELSAFGFCEEGESVVTGFATLGGYPFYIVAQNYAASFGGLTKKNCEKIAKALSAAERSDTPVVYFLHSQGACVSEGVDVLEGISELLLKATQLKGTVLQFAVICGEVYGSAAALAALCDFVFYTKESALCIASPLVLSAKAGKELSPVQIGGYGVGKDLLPALEAADVSEAAKLVGKIFGLVHVPVVDAELNATAPALNKKAGAAEIGKLLEDAVEIGANACPEVKTVLGRLGGIAVAAVIFDGMRINAANVKKIKCFAELACCYGLPLITFVDCLGAEHALAVDQSAVLKEIGEYLNILDATDSPKVSVVTGRAVGLGYSLFAAKSVGFDYSLALATAQISLFEGEEGASIVLAGEQGSAEELSARYISEYGDPIAAARSGYLDDVVEPALVKQHLIAVLQMLM